MGVTVESKNYSMDLGYIGFNRLRQKVADLTADDIAQHYRNLKDGMYLFGDAKNEFFRQYNRRISELDEKYNGKFNYVLDFLYASDCEAEIPWDVCVKIYEVIKDYDDDIIYGYSGRQNGAKFEDFKKIVKDCIDNKCDMTWF